MTLNQTIRLGVPAVLLLLMLPVAGPWAGEDEPEADFQTQVVPIFVRHCVGCHNASELKGELDITSQQSLKAGGESGEVIEPRQADESILWQYVEADDMPPGDQKLSNSEKQLLRQWIDAGAVWSGGAIDPLAYTTDSRSGYDWWSLKPVVRPDVPTVNDRSWPLNDIDRFILAQLEKRELIPSPQADGRTLMRRISIDLTGLPPTPEEFEAFDAASRQSPILAFSDLVDQLLDSPHFGERWARHWLDVIRFGESQGFERNWLRPLAWRYRDWVIHAFNSDMPYNEFVRQQIAGDVLTPEDPGSVIATGYLTCGPWDMASARNGSDTMKRSAREVELEEQIGTLGQAFMGLTLNCARCHDHKFDPISMVDYYSVAASLGGVWRGNRSTQSASGGRDEQNEADVAGRRDGPSRDSSHALEDQIRSIRKEMVVLDADVRESVLAEDLADTRKSVQKLERTLKTEQRKRKDAQSQLDKAKDGVERVELKRKIASAARLILRTQIQLDGSRDQVERLSREMPALSYGKILNRLPVEKREPYRRLVLKASEIELRYELLRGRTTHGVVPREPGVFHVLARGDFRFPLQPVAPNGVAAMKGPTSDFGLAPDASESSRREKLAVWIADQHNPLTARVIVNRLWHYHFGQGLVDTPNDFGFNGGRPSHPKLLDWLADDLIRHKWSLKHIHRLIVSSRTYQQESSATNPLAEETDTDNRLLWRMNSRRLEAETVRDVILAVSGDLNPQMGGPGYRDFEIKSTGMDDHFVSTGVDVARTQRRTLYRTWARSANNSMLDALDCPDPSVTAPKRTITTTPVQALVLLNSPFTSTHAEQFAQRLEREYQGMQIKQIEQAYSRALARMPNTDERQLANQFVSTFSLARFCLMLFNTNEFITID